MSRQCLACAYSPAQRGVQEWKARISIRSQPPPPPPPSSGATDTPSVPAPVVPRSIADTRPSLTPYLCYPCHTTLTSRSARPVPSPWPGAAQSSVVALPVWTEARLGVSTGTGEDPSAADEEVVMAKKMGYDEMKGIVNEFLLDN